MSMTRGNQTGVDAAFKEFLFTRGYLVNDAGENRADCVRALFALGRVFGIRVVSNPQLATFEMVDLASRLIGKEVPAPFYRGFPRSVLALSEDQRIADQLIHYAVTYGLGDFSRPGHSVLEQEFERLAFTEASERRPFSIIGPEEALALVRTAVQDLLASTRPLKADQESVVLAYARRFPADITLCRSKDTAICLLCELREPAYARFIRLPDVIRLADEINVRRGLPGPTDRQAYGEKPVKGQDTGAAPQERSVRKLNLANQDRKLIAKVIDSFFETGEAPDVRECYEKRRLWSGLLHHIHYVPRNPHAAAFAQAMRRGGANRSAEAAFEAAVRRGKIREAAALLAREKGSGALARRLNYLLSRCEKGEDVSAVLSSMGSPNLILLIQMLLQYRNYRPDGRTFRFVQHHRLKTHEETEDERARRRSVLGGDVRALTNHDTTLVLGRNTAGTLELKEDSHGLWGDIRINPNDTDAMNTYERVKRGDVNQCSFGFDIIDEETEFRDDGSVHWTIREVELYEVSVCTFPAYKETSIAAREAQRDQLTQERLESWKEARKAKLRRQTADQDKNKEDN